MIKGGCLCGKIRYEFKQEDVISEIKIDLKSQQSRYEKQLEHRDRSHDQQLAELVTNALDQKDILVTASVDRFDKNAIKASPDIESTNHKITEVLRHLQNSSTTTVYTDLSMLLEDLREMYHTQSHSLINAVRLLQAGREEALSMHGV